MKLIKTKNYQQLSKKAAQLIINQIQNKPTSTIGFATGKTPLGLYKRLVKANKKKQIDFSKIKTFNLDEFYPIKKTNKKSFYYQMHKNLFNKINIKKSNINLLNPETKNWKKECQAYENKIKKNPIDLQILGIGINGHIAFNELGSLKTSKTRLVNLKHKSYKPKALTIGISTILKSKKLLLLASGKNKAKAIKCMLKGKINKECPASYLRQHKNLIIIIDRKAGRLLK